MSPGLRVQRLAALFAAAWVGFNFPLLGLWDRELTLGGVPILLAALFLLWFLLIGVLAWWMERYPGDGEDS